MTGKREFVLTLEGRNTLSVRQSSDMSAFKYYKELLAPRVRSDKRDLQAANIGDHNFGPRMIVWVQGRIWVEEGQNEAQQPEVRQKGYLNVGCEGGI
jgi:hypothetical protein